MQIRKETELEKIPLSFKVVYNNGMIAPPAIPMTSSAEPVFVNLPSPLIANGKIAGHINALAKPSKAIKVIAV